MSKPRGYCIFCGGTPLSKEHLFPEWLQEHHQSVYDDSKHIVTTYDSDGQLTSVARGRLNLKRKMGNHTLRIVCLKCNNGWMSVVQNTAKPILVPMVKGEDTRDLEHNELDALARWFMMTSVIHEYTSPKTRVTSQEDRRALMARDFHLPGWLIWKATLLEPGLEPTSNISAMGLVDDEFPQGRPMTWGMMTLGSVVFYVVNAPLDYSFDLSDTISDKLGFAPIYPSPFPGTPTNGVFENTRYSAAAWFELNALFGGKARDALEQI